MDKNNLNKVNSTKPNSTKPINYLSQPLAHSNVSQRWVTPGMGIVSQGLHLIQQYRELLEPWPFDRTEQTEAYVQLIDNLVVLSGKLSLLSEYRIDTRNVKEENEVYIKEKLKLYKNKDTVISLTEMNLEIEGLDESNKKKGKIYQDLEDSIQRYIRHTTYDGDCYEIKMDEDLCLTVFDVAPKYTFELDQINNTLTILNEFGRYPVRTAQIQLMINHCIQVVIGVTNILKSSIPPVEQRLQIYKKNPVRPGGRNDCLLKFCREMEYWIGELERGGKQGIFHYDLEGGLPYESESYGGERELVDLQEFISLQEFVQLLNYVKSQRAKGPPVYPGEYHDMFIGKKTVAWDNSGINGILGILLIMDTSWEQREMDVHKRVPILTQSFDNIGDYFVNCQFDIFEGVMFANLPYNQTTHAIFKLRYGIKRLKSCIDTITELGGGNKHKIIVYAKLWCNVNNAKWAPYHLETKQMLEQPQFNNSVVLKNGDFKSLCTAYLKVIDDMQILMELYDQAREKRAKLLGIGHQIGYYSRNVSITKYPLTDG